MKIEDNFLKQEEFDKIAETLLLASAFPWFFNDTIDFEDDLGNTDNFQFVHVFYHNHAPQSKFCEKLESIINKIQPISLCRIKANLLTRTSNIVENIFHVDMLGVSEEKLKQWTTSIFYVNTNNGYTKFEDGTKVESVANRMVTFPGNMKHTGTSCTNEQTRVVINFNYFK
jgi:hypothetical protein